MQSERYIGRLAPSPSGHLHVGHAQTFSIAEKRARENKGVLIMRIEDIDNVRCKAHYFNDLLEDLSWFGIAWDEGPKFISNSSVSQSEKNNHDAVSNQTNDILIKNNLGESSLPFLQENFYLYYQSQRKYLYIAAWLELYKKGYIYPSSHSRRQVDKEIQLHQSSQELPSEQTSEPIFPVHLRPEFVSSVSYDMKSQMKFPPEFSGLSEPPLSVNWRFRVPDNEAILYRDNRCGEQMLRAGIDFGDFLVWRGDTNMPSYELAVVVDDHDMNITEVVRGQDILRFSTARQILLYNALSYQIPQFYHCPLVKDNITGAKLAKRARSKSLRALREEGYSPDMIKLSFFSNDILNTP